MSMISYYLCSSCYTTKFNLISFLADRGIGERGTSKQTPLQSYLPPSPHTPYPLTSGRGLEREVFLYPIDTYLNFFFDFFDNDAFNTCYFY